MPKHHYTLFALFFLSCQAPKTSGGLYIPWADDSGPTDTIFLTAAEVDSMPITNPEFFQPVFEEPDTAYYHNPNRLHSEADQDYYHRLYGYFLQQKNGVEKAARGAQLAKIMRAINALEATKAHGGTYFGHMYPRIEGYAAYELQQPWQEQTFSKERKDSFIRSLEQSLNDEELELDSNRLSLAKSQIQTIDTLIANAFILEQAIKFHRTRYRQE